MVSLGVGCGFGAAAADCASHRPAYPPDLFDYLASLAARRCVAWDCATGTGQAASGLARHVAHVIATDASATQIVAAVPLPNVEYRVAPVEASGLTAASVDPVTVAQALHWIDPALFFDECRRVLGSGGILAVWTYGPLRVAGAEVNRVIQRYSHEIVGSRWPPERRHVETGCRSITLPFPELEAPAFAMHALWTLDEVLGYLGTWSSTTAHARATGRDPRDRIARALAGAWRTPDAMRRVTWPLTLRVCRAGPA